MPRTIYDFDVITGPSTPRPTPKPPKAPLSEKSQPAESASEGK
jgi:hypothetical protein